MRKRGKGTFMNTVEKEKDREKARLAMPRTTNVNKKERETER